MSFWQRVSADASNAMQDVYSHWVLGDDAGKSAHITYLHKSSDKLPTFLEINGRAYVKAVVPGSAADQAGVLPQDAVQLAVLVRPEWVAEHKDDTDGITGGGGGGGGPLAVRYALDLERKGARITYDQLRRLVFDNVLNGPQYFLSPPTAEHDPGSREARTTWNGPPIPSTICAPMMMSNDDSYRTGVGFEKKQSFQSNADANDNDDDNIDDEQQPIVFVFRRTRQRQSEGAAASTVLLPAAFRLDDECDLAVSLVRRLAPTADMRAPVPDTWEELVHDGTDWLLGTGSMLPPKHYAPPGGLEVTAESGILPNNETIIPWDDYERVRAQKLATLRSRMAAEAMQVDRTEDVEAATIRGMIQKAVGLAFVRASKVVLGVSIHGGSGIVISRLSDGTWSAPSAIGTWGLGLGLQFGLEVAEYIFILQTNEALQHFKRGGSYTVGGNMGLAVAGLGREAYGAASVGGGCGTNSNAVQLHDDEYNDDNDSREERQYRQSQSSLAIAPIVAYAKSQGLYVGVSLEGSRIFTRNDLNSRTYKFASGRDVTANDILSGKVPTPPEAEELYAALHSVEFTHEMSCLPRPPEVLRKDSANAWHYDRSTLAASQTTLSPSDLANQAQQPFSFFSKMTQQERDECETFEAQFKNFMYGGVSVQRLIPNTDGRSGRTSKERRTLWLMLPEVGSLRLGFVSKLSDGDGAVSNKSSTQRARRDDRSRISGGLDGDVGTVESEDLTLDSALHTRDGSTIGPIRTGNVQLSDKHSLALSDVTVLSQEPEVPVHFSGEDKMQHLRVISIQDVSGTTLLFLANNFREAELLVCGLKLLLERETARLGVRGGLPITALGGRNREGAMSPAAARGFREVPSKAQTNPSRLRKGFRGRKNRSGYDSSDAGDESMISENNESSMNVDSQISSKKGRKWGKQPGRDYMRGQASSLVDTEESGLNEKGVPQYIHGQQIVKDVAKNVQLPLPLPLCRVLLLDSTSPVIKQWESDRGDSNFDKTRWVFPPATPRELERHSSEHQLIASGSMCGAHRTTSFDRPRYGSLVRLSETHTVEADDPKKVIFTVTERNPRRGFSVKVRIILRAHKDNECDASVFAEVRPVGKDMSNQAAVHKAFLLVLDEVKLRYGREGTGLLAGFLSVVDEMAEGNRTSVSKSKSGDSLARPFRLTDPLAEEKKVDGQKTDTNKDISQKSGLVSFEDMLKTGRESPEIVPNDRPMTPSLRQQIPEANPAKRVSAKIAPISESDEFAAPRDEQPKVSEKKDPVLIEVKPLPKIRLSLMPSPREEDEDESSSSSPVPSKPIKKKKHSRSRSSGPSRKSRSSNRKSSR